MQEAGTYLEEVADDTQQPEIKTVEDFWISIENQQLYQILIKVDKLTLQIALNEDTRLFYLRNSSLSQHHGESCLQANGQAQRKN